ncbi:MAG: 3-hydroxyacyl-CoA dehydrogenase NAD-binding domain-containing protein, partial [Planctomycetaceae bacterium]
GAGIAQLAAYQGFEVVVKEIDDAALQAGMERIRGLFDDAVTKKRLRREEADERLKHVTPTTDWEPLADADLVIEAVVERADIKHAVFRELDRRCKPETVFASNTSALSVTEMGAATERPERVAGLHFFNPVHRMDLVEVVRTEASGDETLGLLVQFVRKLGKTPVVTADAPGFLVNRVLFPYLGEAVRMVVEGQSPERIDKALRRFGMPMGPLELLDQVGVDVAAHVSKTMQAVLPDAGPVAERLTAMVERGRLGKKSGQGFYEYAKGRRGKPLPWEGQSRAEPGRSGTARPDSDLPRTGNAVFDSGNDPQTAAIQRRLVYPLINESAGCLSRGVVAEAWMADLAMVLGTGFAPFRGGPLRLADEIGSETVVADLRRLEEQFGERFAPCSLPARMATDGRRFYETERPREVATEQKLLVVSPD